MSSTIESFKRRIGKCPLLRFTPALLLLASGAYADPMSVAVKYGDLNLENVDDAKILYARLRHASQRVCQFEIGDLSRQAAYLRCVENALNDAVAQVEWPLPPEQIGRMLSARAPNSSR